MLETTSNDSNTKISEDIKNEISEMDLDYLNKELPIAFKQTLDGIQHISHIVKAMKSLSYNSGDYMQPTDINDAIKNTIIISRSEWKYVAEIETNFDTNLPQIPCYSRELNQIILNLIVNATHAIADSENTKKGVKGKITIRTSFDNNYVHISISDTGTGIKPEIKDKIFKPFFTTKERGKGTGQGLAITHKIILDKHGGKINCESTLNEGTAFHISLPIRSNKPQQEENQNKLIVNVR